MSADLFVSQGADFSACRTWRYTLWRLWDPARPNVMFVMLNPSTADETVDDPTVAKCQRYARRWGYGGLFVCNLFAYRATDPAAMKRAANPIGPDNDAFIMDMSAMASAIVCAWGNHGAHLGRCRQVLDLLRGAQANLSYLKMNKTGEPQHPLYLTDSLSMVPYAL